MKTSIGMPLYCCDCANRVAKNEKVSTWCGVWVKRGTRCDGCGVVYRLSLTGAFSHHVTGIDQPLFVVVEASKERCACGTLKQLGYAHNSTLELFGDYCVPCEISAA